MSNPDPTLYFDHSATTPPHPEVRDAMQHAMATAWGNPSSLHEWGRQAATVTEIARQQLADLINASPDSIIFTSGGTESNNLALYGIAKQYSEPQHMIVSTVEHSSVYNVAKQLEQSGWQITRLPVTSEGLIDPGLLEASIQTNTALVSIVHGQNEIGVIQPIATIGSICRQAGVLFHSDCVQTAGRIPLDVETLGVDLLSISSHKLYGPQGVGILYLRPDLSLEPLLQGGGQERKLRSGTQAVPNIVGFGVAAELALKSMATETQRLQTLQQYCHQELKDQPRLRLTGPHDFLQRLPNHLSYCVAGMTGTSIVLRMNQAGIGISAGSACSRGTLVPSRILLALGLTSEQALGSIRLSMGKTTTQTAVDQMLVALKQVLNPT